jgi:signal transduction histidine kinase
MEERQDKRGAQSARRRRVATKPAAALFGATLFSAVALVVIAGLTAHASTTRTRDDTIDAVVTRLNELDGVPVRFQTAAGLPDGAASRALRASTLGNEQAILTALRRLQQTAPVPGLRGIGAPLAENFRTLNRAVELITAHQFARAALLGPALIRTHDIVAQALSDASQQYQSQTSAAELEATLGAIAVVLLLLGGFAFFYLRAYQAHAESDELTAELQRSEAHLERAQRLAGVGSWEWDPAAKTLSFSAEHARLHGWVSPEPPRDPTDVLGLVSPDDRARVEEALGAAVTHGTPVDFDYRVGEAYGGRLIHVTATTVIGPDGRRRLIGTSQDVTERFRRAEAERANRAKDEFISRMSHELRTPLNAVLGFGQLLTMSDLDERQRANVEHILSAGRHLLAVINDILDISRIESGDLRLSLEPVSVCSVIAAAVDLVAPIAEPRRIAVNATLPDPDLWVHADAQRFRQVLLNLLSNAVKYNHDDGHIAIAASVTADHVEIAVTDDGPGIAPDKIDRLFSPFERLGAEQSAVEGTGLGLAVSRGMIEAMGGRIAVRSEPGRGAAFTIELDVAADNRPAAASAALAGVRSGA